MDKTVFFQLFLNVSNTYIFIIPFAIYLKLCDNNVVKFQVKGFLGQEYPYPPNWNLS